MTSSLISQSKDIDQTQKSYETVSISQESSIPNKLPENKRESSQNNEISQVDNSCLQILDPDEENVPIVNPQSEMDVQTPLKPFSQQYLAKVVIKENRITNVPAQGSFLVSGTNGTKKYAVTLHPEDCSCPSTRTCHHIIAARIAAGLPNIDAPINTISLTKLSKNSRKKADKKSGRKKARLLDVDVEPAPDSLYMTSSPGISNTDELKTVQKKENIPKSKKKIIFDSPLSKTNSEASLKQKNDLSEIPEEKESPDMPVLSPIGEVERQNRGQNTVLPATIPPSTPPLINLNESLEKFPCSPENISSWWIEKYHLTSDDLDILLSPSRWLNEKHMAVASQILKKQFSMKINGFHDTTHTPFPMNNYWKYDNKFPLTSSPAIQIHFNGSDHWVTSAKYNGNVYFLDSIFMPITGNINTNLELQLVAMYGSPGREMEVTIPRLQQQNNCNDCGLFAIANAVEISYNQYPWERRVLFMKDEMRGHLIKCFEEEKFTRFPSKANNYKSTKKKIYFYYLLLWNAR